MPVWYFATMRSAARTTAMPVVTVEREPHVPCPYGMRSVSPSTTSTSWIGHWRRSAASCAKVVACD